jgi:hypothetical protein
VIKAGKLIKVYFDSGFCCEIDPGTAEVENGVLFAKTNGFPFEARCDRIFFFGYQEEEESEPEEKDYH